MKVGMILECGPGGADEKVYVYLAKRLDPNIVIIPPVTLDNKRRLFEQCSAQAKALLEIENCEKVIIIWDLQPPLREAGRYLCIIEECNLINRSLDEIGLTAQQRQRVHLICVKQELETLLLADERAVASYLSKRTQRACRIPRFRDPERPDNPKKELNRIFKRHIGYKYNDRLDAERVIRLADIDEIWRCSSFVRFADKVVGISRHEF